MTIALVASAGAAAAPASFQLVFAGRHNAALLHEGTFTSSLSLCPSGTAADLSVDSTTDTALRRFACAGGDDFTARVSPLPAEHGGNGTWQIVSGTGTLANLRGKGTFSSTRVSGHSDDPATISFRSAWDGAADFDVTPPGISVMRAAVKKLKQPKGSYTVRVSLAFAGDSTVSFVLQVVDPRKPGNTLAYKLGKTTTGSASSSFRIKPSRTTRVAQLKIDAEDAVGNSASFVKTVRLR